MLNWPLSVYFRNCNVSILSSTYVFYKNGERLTSAFFFNNGPCFTKCPQHKHCVKLSVLSWLFPHAELYSALCKTAENFQMVPPLFWRAPRFWSSRCVHDGDLDDPGHTGLWTDCCASPAADMQLNCDYLTRTPDGNEHHQPLPSSANHHAQVGTLMMKGSSPGLQLCHRFARRSQVSMLSVCNSVRCGQDSTAFVFCAFH